MTLLGGQLLGRVARKYVAVLLGQEWHKGQTRRLYGTLIDPIEGHFELGYVDRVTGDLHPKVDGGLNKNLGTGKGYLEWLAAHDPGRPGIEESSRVLARPRCRRTGCFTCRPDGDCRIGPPR